MDESKWPYLPYDILQIIANLLNINTDTIQNFRLRSVCKSWRSSFSPLPLVVSLKFSTWHFYYDPTTLSATTIYLLQPKPSRQSSSSSCWLVKFRNNKWSPLEPLPKVFTNDSGLPNGFPNLINLLNFRIARLHTYHTLDTPFYNTDKAVLSTLTSPPVIMALYGGYLWFFELGKPITIRSEISSPWARDLIFHKGKFYVVENKGNRWRVVSFSGYNFKEVEILKLRFPYDDGEFDKLVKSNGALYVTVKYVYPKAVQAVRLKIFKLNEDSRELERVCDLDNHVFFAFYYSYSVPTRDFPTLKTNYVYFCDESFMDANNKEEKLGTGCNLIGVYFVDDNICGPLAKFPDQWPPFFGLSNLPNPKAPKYKKNCTTEPIRIKK